MILRDALHLVVHAKRWKFVLRVVINHQELCVHALKALCSDDNSRELSRAVFLFGANVGEQVNLVAGNSATRWRCIFLALLLFVSTRILYAV